MRSHRKKLLEYRLLTANGSAQESSACQDVADRIFGNGEFSILGGILLGAYADETDVHQLRYKLPARLLCNGVGVSIRLCGWEWIKYVAVGYTHLDQFRHVKIPNIALDQWVELSVGHNDLAYRIQNGWQPEPAAELGDLRIYIKGTPGSGKTATLEVRELSCWLEDDAAPRLPHEHIFNDRLLALMYAYWRKCFRSYADQARAFMESGSFPVYGEDNLAWNPELARPEGILSLNTYRFSWHALHSVAMLLLYSEQIGHPAPLYAARELVTNWMDASYFKPDEDQKYTWYDHGTAERLMAMLAMWQQGIMHGFDARFMSRLHAVIVAHAELLASEAFYASHQPTRYHNHAWFQDMALIAAGICLPECPVACAWIDRAVERLKDQFEHLIVREGGYAIFVENSIGYHQGVQRLIEFCGQLAELAGKGPEISAIARELDAWSERFRYPDGRTPAQGDTFRTGNQERQPRPGGRPWNDDFLGLRRAGYMVVRGGARRDPWMLSVFGTNLNDTHKHEDDLSFTLFLDGVEWLIDPSFLSHEYAQEEPAYLRSARAHNMLSLPGRRYDYSATSGRVELKGSETAGGTTIRGVSRSYAGFAIARRLTCRAVDALPELQGDDSFTVAVSSDEPSPAAATQMGLLNFHLGDGVQVFDEIPADGVDGRLAARFRLTHPASSHVLTLEVMRLAGGWVPEVEVVDSISGLGFMKSTETKSIRVSVPCGVRCNWKLHVHQ